MAKFWLLIYPELTRIPQRERDAVLGSARATPFDGLELAAIALGLALTAGATRYVVFDGLTHRIEAFLANFLLAVPLLAVLAGPFFIRRTRRGLHHYLTEHPQRGAREQ
ncbi:hypothetical protein LLG90_22030 [Aromatoleum toluclasticum]|uniref:hypothetical protein n=1 Tax=Aromatoleum toluclasticum TaxID=92003 RepID=UPI001D1853ED|nr:hypothetical protein [Aromatoleum toluclasticum]MCC4118037.1 hypothetical protein [Aromatoleum toluclasticum]